MKPAWRLPRRLAKLPEIFMKLSTLTLTALTAVLPLSSFGALQKDTVPYNHFRAQISMQAGQPYLTMMISQVKPGLDAFKGDIDQEASQFPNQYRKWQTDLVAAGAGVAIRIDEHNYFFNVGYGDGSNGSDDLKSGRSYGVGPTGRQSDPSDIAYLTELEQYLQSEPQNAPAFYSAILKAILNSDTSGWAQLSSAGQIVATDFLAIYTAELDRHLMVDLKPTAHPWEIDLAAATFDAAYVAASGKMVKDGQLTEGSVKDFWAPGKQGSGIGETRTDRKALQKILAKFESSQQAGAATIREVQEITGSNNADVIQGMLEYVNSPEQANHSALNVRNAAALEKAMLDYLNEITADAQQITE
jgi:hypothetical protein